MEIPFRVALIDWLASDPALGAALNAVVEEAPSRVALPWLALTASARQAARLSAVLTCVTMAKRSRVGVRIEP